MNILFGHYVPDEGIVPRRRRRRHAAARCPPGSPGAALAAGIGMVHQHFTLAENLTGLDNIVLGTEPVWQPFRDRSGARRQDRGDHGRERARRSISDVQVANLTVGEKQRVEILKALYRDVRVLILDEPTAVLTPQEADGLFAVLRRLAAKGLGVIFISHKLGEVLAVSPPHHGAARRQEGGRDRRPPAPTAAPSPTSWSAAPSSSRAHAAPQPGATGPRVRPRGAEARLGAPVAERSELCAAGQGRSSASPASPATASRRIAALICRPRHARRRRRCGSTASRSAAPIHAALVAAGVARMPEDRQHDGVVGAMTVAENIAIEDLRDPRLPAHRLPQLQGDARRAPRAPSRAYDIRCPGPDAEARLLSGGNVQKLILARVLEREPAADPRQPADARPRRRRAGRGASPHHRGARCAAPRCW